MPKVRVSVANLAFAMQSGTGPLLRIGIPNPKKLKAGETLYQALGGGAELTEAGTKFLVEQFRAEGFEYDDRSGRADARFVVEEDQLEAVFEWFSGIGDHSTVFEFDPRNDIMEELTGKEFPEMGTILSSAEAEQLDVVYVRTVRQKPAEEGVGTSSRAASASYPTRRLFRMYVLRMPEGLVEKVRRSPIVRILTESELASTDGGAKKGITADGKAMADNLILF